MAVASAITSRRKNAVESFKTASECIGKIEKYHSVFAMTRGQFSMIDAILACLDQVGPARLSVWTWTVAEYEIECFERLMMDDRLIGAILIIDAGARNKNLGLLEKWQRVFGDDSIRYVVNHSKIATIETDDYSLLLRGSMNLNFNPRFEQFDLTEGGDDFTLVKQIESELPILPNSCLSREPREATKINLAFSQEQLNIFEPGKIWAK